MIRRSPVRMIAGEIAVVVFTVRRGHHDLDVLADHLVGSVAEQPLCRGAERLHDAALVDHDHGVRHGIEDGLHMRLARRGAFRALRCLQPARAQTLAKPGNADPERRKCEGAGNVDRE